MAKKTRKFSEFVDGNSIVAGDQTVGLRNNQNTIFDATTGGGGGGGAVSQVITQANTFDVGDWVRYDGANYVKAQANTASNAESIGVVTVASATEFTLTMAGLVDLSTSSLPYVPLTAGDVYFLSHTTSGEASQTEPSAINHVSKPVMVAVSTTEGWVLPYRGELLNGGVSPAAGGGGGNSVAINIVGHGFSTNDVIRVNGTNTYTKAYADSATNAEAVGIVEKVDNDNFILYTEGYMGTLSGLTANTLYYLTDDPLAVTQLVTTKPTTAGAYDKPMLYTVDTGAGFVFSRRADPVSGPVSNAQTITQPGHPFTTVGQFAKPSGVAGQYDLAQADTLANSRAVGMITAISGNDYTIQFSGYFDFGGVPPLLAINPGVQYYLSELAAGSYTATEPTGTNEVSKPVLSAISTTEAWILEQRPMLQPNANGGAGAGAGGTLISSITATSVANIDFDGILDGTYKYIEINICDLEFSTTNNLLRMVFGTGGGPSYGAALHDYITRASYGVSAVPTFASSSGNSAAWVPLTTSTVGIRAPSPWLLSGKIYFYGSHNGAYKYGFSDMSYHQWGASVRPVGDECNFSYRDATNVTSIRFTPIAGTLDSGTIQVIGYT